MSIFNTCQLSIQFFLLYFQFILKKQTPHRLINENPWRYLLIFNLNLPLWWYFKMLITILRIYYFPYLQTKEVHWKRSFLLVQGNGVLREILWTFLFFPSSIFSCLEVPKKGGYRNTQKNVMTNKYLQKQVHVFKTDSGLFWT